MSSFKSFTVVDYDSQGTLLELRQIEPSQLDSGLAGLCEQKLERLPGDLELPLEGTVPGEWTDLVFRISSDFKGATVTYYWQDTPVWGSLILRGEDAEAETELCQVFRYLLLDTSDRDDPTDSEMDAILDSSAFDFRQHDDRPVVFAVHFCEQSEEPDLCRHLSRIDPHLAAAFFSRCEKV